MCYALRSCISHIFQIRDWGLREWKTIRGLSELKTMDLGYFIFIFIFYCWLKAKKTKKMTQSHKSHAHIIQWNNVEGSREDDIIWYMSKIAESGLCFFLFYFIFLFHLFFIFSIFRTLELGLEVISHISHIWWYSHYINHETKEKEVKGSRIK